MKKICIVGLGYIGLPTASIMATNNFQVYGVDINQEMINDLKKGKVHIYEPGLNEVVKNVIQSGNLEVLHEPVTADAFILAVPTPFNEDHQADLSYVRAAAEMIAPYIKEEDLIILESTSPVGTTEKVGEWICQRRRDLYYRKDKEIKQLRHDQKEFFLVHCPERVLPGKILSELVENDRLIGGINWQSAQMAREIYKQFVKGEIILTDARTAEMAKLTENAFRDLNIAFANELSMVCEKLEIDVWELIKLANRHPRVNILQPGPGVGGHCIAVDPWFIINSAPEETKMMRMAREVNDFKPEFVLNKVYKELEKKQRPVIAALGLAFKADVDDLRESPAVNIVEKLAKKKLSILVVEPYIKSLPANLLKYENLKLCGLDEALEKAEIILGLVNHKQFNEIDVNTLKEKSIIDTRGMF